MPFLHTRVDGGLKLALITRGPGAQCIIAPANACFRVNGMVPSAKGFSLAPSAPAAARLVESMQKITQDASKRCPLLFIHSFGDLLTTCSGADTGRLACTVKTESWRRGADT